MKTIQVLLLLACVATLHAEAVKDREGAVRSDRAAMEKNDRWIYNDVERGFAEAARTGKPLLVALRCVPCKACMGLDASILASDELQPLLSQFVCVRIINANTLDLSLFQFDYDLSFSTLFFNADRTLYGRYGSWRHQKDTADTSTAGYKASLMAALAVHQGYPKNKAALAVKQGGPAPFKVPVEIPSLAEKYGRELDWGGKVVQSCVHCHQIGDAFRASYRKAGKPIPAELIYPMPAPETIGLTLDGGDIAKVTAVAEGSAAAAAGIQPGDDLVTVNGAPPVSIADVAWALHRSPEEGALQVTVRRALKEEPHTITLAPGWRLKSDISTRVGTWPMRGMATGGLALTDLDDTQRSARHIPAGEMALLVKFVGQFGIHGEAKKAGFQKDDVLISVDGSSKRTTESELIGQLLLHHPAKESVKATVLRGDQRVELMLPMQ